MDQLLLKGPTDYQSGFWLSYKYNGQLCRASSTETKCFSNVKTVADEKKLVITLEHTPPDSVEKIMGFRVELWSYESPMLLIKHTSTNLSKAPIEDLKLFNLMDFDLGGATSYKDDTGAFDPEEGIMRVCDGTPLCVAMASRPSPNGWEISAPTKLRLTDEERDLKKNLEAGPKDIASGLQWNLGNLEAGASRSVCIAMTVGQTVEEVNELLPRAWQRFDEKMQ
ncbi:hypothetical protein EU538_12110 [Candidatus Thorarchaeota archaeon]|nr:MAG: hypothetical protein EU538_12110 [Candidatus Thorarchaeota archaeon]